jgi:hypothetical protein
MDMHQFLTEELEKIDEIYATFINETADKKAKFINPLQDATRILSTAFLEDYIELTKRLYDGAKRTLARAEEEGFDRITIGMVAEEISPRCKEYLSAFLGEN